MLSDDGTFFQRIKSFIYSGHSEKSTAQETEIADQEDTHEAVWQTSGSDQDKIAALRQVRTVMHNSDENEIASVPMATRTVNAATDARAAEAPLPINKDLDILFATKFIELGGKFMFCETMKEAVETLQALKNNSGWGHIFGWENEIKDAFANYGFQKGVIGFTLENSDAAISLCESLVAEEGLIILNPKQASRRSLPCFPKVQIVLTDVSRLVRNEEEGIAEFTRKYKGELPSVIKIGACNKGHFYDKQRLILNAGGPENVFVILIDEFIPPSTRP